MPEKASDAAKKLWADPEYRKRQMDARAKSKKFKNSTSRFKKGQTAWNKGMPMVWHAKTAESKKGKPSGKLGKRYAPRLSLVCEQCGISFERYTSQCSLLHHFCSRDCAFIWRRTEAFKKEQSDRIRLAAEREGVGPAPYDYKFNASFKDEIRARDGHCCRECGKLWERGTRRFPIHHIDYDKSNCDPKNLVTLCKSCHSKTNWGRRAWTVHYTAIMERAKLHVSTYG